MEIKRNLSVTGQVPLFNNLDQFSTGCKQLIVTPAASTTSAISWIITIMAL
jgi:hypothetical protein